MPIAVGHSSEKPGISDRVKPVLCMLVSENGRCDGSNRLSPCRRSILLVPSCSAFIYVASFRLSPSFLGGLFLVRISLIF
jgi:hypothetical protein